MRVILEDVEPVPMPRGPGRIIMLNGASSSGKSTLAAALRAVLDEPFLHVSSDQFVAAGMLPTRREDGGRHVADNAAHRNDADHSECQRLYE